MEKKMKMRIGLSVLLVLALTSVSGAALSMSLSAYSMDISGVVVPIVITISSDLAEATTWGVYLDPTSDYPTDAKLQNATILAAAGSNGAVTSGGSPTAGNNYKSQGGAVKISAGNWSTVQFVGLTVGTYTIDLYKPAGGAQVATADIVVVPEPATIGLLGLGGLLLLRRRR